MQVTRDVKMFMMKRNFFTSVRNDQEKGDKVCAQSKWYMETEKEQENLGN